MILSYECNIYAQYTVVVNYYIRRQRAGVHTHVHIYMKDDDERLRCGRLSYVLLLRREGVRRRVVTR